MMTLAYRFHSKFVEKAVAFNQILSVLGIDKGGA